MFFIQQLRGLEDPEAPSFKRYFYLLEVNSDGEKKARIKVFVGNGL